MEKRDGIIAQLRLEARALEDRAGVVPTLKLPIFEGECAVAGMQAHAEYGDMCWEEDERLHSKRGANDKERNTLDMAGGLLARV